MHVPVLQKEILEFLKVEPDKDFIDCTLGEAGHTLAILEKSSPGGRVLAVELDPEMFAKTKVKLDGCFRKAGWDKKRIILENDNFSNIKEIVEKHKFKPSGILFDLGFSSWHLESKRGFSFLKEEKLDMRYNPLYSETAADIVNNYSEKELENILREFSDERFARRIAREIVKERKLKKIETTSDLVKIINKAVFKRSNIHPATRTFQALRIATNKELENIQKALEDALKVLNPGGRICVISFHSLEDRISKNFFKGQAKEGLLKIITKKPIKPSKEEIEVNPRSRSALLRVAEKSI